MPTPAPTPALNPTVEVGAAGAGRMLAEGIIYTALREGEGAVVVVESGRG